MTEKNIFPHQLFLSLNISEIDFFYVKIATPSLNQVTPLFPSKPRLKVEVLPSPPLLFENLVEGSTPSSAEKGWLHTMIVQQL